MMIVAVASKNPIKIEAVRSALDKIYREEHIEIYSANVESGVNKQPLSSTETLKGAYNRVEAVHKKYLNADLCIGIEGGVQYKGDKLFAFAWIVISSNNKVSKTISASFQLPPAIAKLIKKGYELGEADDIIFKKNNSKQKNGAVGLLTNNVITRKELYEQAVVLALIPHINTDLY